jgi:hypothetical protein
LNKKLQKLNNSYRGRPCRKPFNFSENEIANFPLTSGGSDSRCFAASLSTARGHRRKPTPLEWFEVNRMAKSVYKWRDWNFGGGICRHWNEMMDQGDGNWFRRRCSVLERKP